MVDTSTPRRSISLGFTEDKVTEGQHICYLFNDDVERLRVMAKYFESGLLEGEKLLYLADAMTPGEMLDCLEELGVDARSKPSLTVAEAASAYCPHGVFNADDMLTTMREFYTDAVEKQGYPGARGTGEMSWCLVEGRADEISLMDYEARLTLLVRDYPLTACCQYDTRRFDGTVIFDVLTVHPVMIVRGQLVRNPFFIEPRIFLEELSRRKTGRG